MDYYYILIEGPDDERYFRWYFTHFSVVFIQYSSWKKEKINNFINSINHTPNKEYIYIADADAHSVEEKVKKISDSYSAISTNNIIVVQREIESWYLAGLTCDACEKFRIKPYTSTDNLTKEEFNTLIPKGFGRIDFMIEILKKYNIECARSHNRTLCRFMSTYSK